MTINYRQPYQNELYHHGILGQKWGVRRFQNPDGSLTAAGRKRLGLDKKQLSDWTEAESKGYSMYRRHEKIVKLREKLNDDINQLNELGDKANNSRNAMNRYIRETKDLDRLIGKDKTFSKLVSSVENDDKAVYERSVLILNDLKNRYADVDPVKNRLSALEKAVNDGSSGWRLSLHVVTNLAAMLDSLDEYDTK